MGGDDIGGGPGASWRGPITQDEVDEFLEVSLKYIDVAVYFKSIFDDPVEGGEE